MKSLLLKKKIIFINIKKIYKIFIIRVTLLYFFFKKKLILLLFLCNCFFNKQSIVVKNLISFYSLKWKCNSFFVLKNILNSLIEFFYNVKDLGFIKNLKSLSNSKYFVSVIRSPFVYKKSMEQFIYKQYKISYQTNISIYNYFFDRYKYIYLKKVLQKNIILKLFCKITFNFN